MRAFFAALLTLTPYCQDLLTSGWAAFLTQDMIGIACHDSVERIHGGPMRKARHSFPDSRHDARDAVLTAAV